MDAGGEKQEPLVRRGAASASWIACCDRRARRIPGEREKQRLKNGLESVILQKVPVIRLLSERRQTIPGRIQADMAELADAPDLGSGVYDVQVQVLLSAVEFL